MPTYRAYFLDENDKIVSFQPIDAEADDKALELAKRFVDGHDIEVWLLDRRIGRLNK